MASLPAAPGKIFPSEQAEEIEIEKDKAPGRNQERELQDWLSRPAGQPVSGQLCDVKETAGEYHGPDKLVHKKIMNAPGARQIDGI